MSGAPPPSPGRAPPPDQPRVLISLQERDANGLPLYSTLMDNIIAGRAAVANLNVTAEGMLQMQYAKALLTKAVEKQVAGADSRRRMYSPSSGSRAASSSRPSMANTLNCPPPEPLQLQPQAAHTELSTNDPRPTNNMVAA